MRPPPPPWFHDEMDRLAEQWQSEPPVDAGELDSEDIQEARIDAGDGDE